MTTPKPTKFITRDVDRIEAMRLSEDNAEAVAAWCNGIWTPGVKGSAGGRLIVGGMPSFYAHLGHWVIHRSVSWSVMDDDSFNATFQLDNQAIVVYGD